MVEVTGVDFAARQVATDHGPVSYDYLILAAGGETNYFGLDGIVRHGFGLKSVVEAGAVPEQGLSCFERAMLEPDPRRRRGLPSLVGLGGGAAGGRSGGGAVGGGPAGP